MLDFLLNLLIPIVVAIILIPLLYSIIKMLLDIVGLNIKFIKIILFLVAYYFIGPLVLDLLVKYVMNDISSIVEWIYTPFKLIIALF